MDSSRRGFLQLFGKAALGAVALSVLPDLGVAKELVGERVLWTPERGVTPVKLVEVPQALEVIVRRWGSQEELLHYSLAVKGGMVWTALADNCIWMEGGVFQEICVTSKTFVPSQENTFLSVVTSGGYLSVDPWRV